MLTGVAASEGIAIGTVYCLKKDLGVMCAAIRPDQVPAEISRWETALQEAKEQIEKLQQMTLASVGQEHARIFEAHLAMLDDRELYNHVAGVIRSNKSAEWAVQDFITVYQAIFAGMDDEYMRERAQDIGDIGRRLILCLRGEKPDKPGEWDRPVIVVADELTPSETVQLTPANTLGFATDRGGRTSHTAILARTMKIPAVVGLKDITGQVASGDTVIVDGTRGEVILRPDPAAIARYRLLQAELRARECAELETVTLPAVTTDGHAVELFANIGHPEEAAGALAYGAQGIGLLRTEFLFLDRETLPDEEEQFAAYKQAVEIMPGRPVIIRTLDIGGDKNVPYIRRESETNPFLGVRGIRLCLDEPELFRAQLRAILRASAFGAVWVMFPMITTVDEIRRARAITAAVRQELVREGIPVSPDIPIGIMVEVPAVAIAADLFVPQVDFFSIGTNDLMQYTLAADRMNERLGPLNNPWDPAVLRLIKQVIDAGKRGGKPVGMCGEMAGDPQLTVTLLGLGLEEFSMSAPSLPRVKRIIRNVSRKQAEEIAARVLELGDAKAAREYAEKALQELLS